MNKKKKIVNFSPSMLKIQRNQKLNDDLKDSERSNPGITKQVQNLIQNLSEENLKKNANKAVDIYLEEAKGEGDFDFLKDEIDEEEANILRNDRTKFRRSEKLRLDK